VRRLLSGLIGSRLPVEQRPTGRLLVVKLFAIGDCLNATPLLRSLRACLPGWRIDILTGEWSSAVFAGNPNCDDMIVIPDGWFREHRFLPLLNLAWQLRKKRYNLALVVHRAPEIAAFIALTGIPVRIGLDLEGDGFLFTHPVTEPGGEHEIRAYNRLLTPLGGATDDVLMEVYASSEELQFAGRLWKEAAIDDRTVIGLTVGGASNPDTLWRLWPHYGELAQRLCQRHLNVALFGGPTDRKAGDEVIRSLEEALSASDVPGRIRSFVGKTSLGVTAELMKRCAVIVAHDAGPMHLAAAAGCRTLSLFAPTDPRLKAPLTPDCRWLAADLQCSPCYHRGRYGTGCSTDCMASISVETVLQSLMQMLEERSLPF